MNFIKRTRCIGLVLFACLVSQGYAQSYPNKPVRIVVAGAAGASGDILTRLVAQKLGEYLGQPVITENRPGAGGLLGAEYVARSAPDGYTLLLNNSTLWAIMPSVRKTLPYDPSKSFVSVAMLATADNMLLVNKNHHAKTLAELIQYARANPGKLNYGSAGIATPAHLAGEMLGLYANIKMTHVAYKGAAQAMVDMIAGTIDFIVTSPIAAAAQIKNDTVRILATTGSNRNPSFPDIAPMGDTVPGYELSQSWGFSAPTGVGRDVIEKLNGAIGMALRQPDVTERIRALGAMPVGGTSAHFDKYITSERQRMQDLIVKSGVTLD